MKQPRRSRDRDLERDQLKLKSLEEIRESRLKRKSFIQIKRLLRKLCWSWYGSRTRRRKSSRRR